MLTVGAVTWTRWQIWSGVACSSSRTASSTSCRWGVMRMPRSCNVLRRALRPLAVSTTAMVGREYAARMRVLALLDGTLADPDAPLIRVDDLGLMRGDGIFETVLVVNGRP